MGRRPARRGRHRPHYFVVLDSGHRDRGAPGAHGQAPTWLDVTVCLEQTAGTMSGAVRAQSAPSGSPSASDVEGDGG